MAQYNVAPINAIVIIIAEYHCIHKFNPGSILARFSLIASCDNHYWFSKITSWRLQFLCS